MIEAKEIEKANEDFKSELESQQQDNEDPKDTTEAKEAYALLEEAHIHHT
jgi:hypothetical protein